MTLEGGWLAEDPTIQRGKELHNECLLLLNQRDSVTEETDWLLVAIQLYLHWLGKLSPALN